MAAVAPAGPIGPVGPRRSGLEAELVLGKAYDIRLLRRLARYVRTHAWLRVAWVAVMLVRPAFDLAQPGFIAYVLQHHVLGSDGHGVPSALPLDALAYVGLVIGQNLSSF